MLATGEKKILHRRNKGQRVAAAKQLLVPSVTSDSASLNVKVRFLIQVIHCTACIIVSMYHSSF